MVWLFSLLQSFIKHALSSHHGIVLVVLGCWDYKDKWNILLVIVYCILGDKICKLIFLLQHSNFFNISICKTIGTANSDGLNGEEASEGKDHLF